MDQFLIECKLKHLNGYFKSAQWGGVISRSKICIPEIRIPLYKIDRNMFKVQWRPRKEEKDNVDKIL